MKLTEKDKDILKHHADWLMDPPAMTHCQEIARAIFIAIDYIAELEKKVGDANEVLDSSTV